MKQTAVEWLAWKFATTDIEEFKDNFNEFVNQAKEMENNRAREYAEFAIRCDRMNMKILNFEDWIKLETFKSE